MAQHSNWRDCQALQFLEKEGRLKEWMVLLTLLKDCKFAMDHIAHDLFMDVVKWYSLENTSSMQYSEKAWKEAGLTFSTTSNEACKLWDASLTQYVGWYDEPSLGGLEATVGKLLEADPENVMAYVMLNGLDTMGTGRSPRLDPEFQASLDKMTDLAKTKASATEWEKSHAKAVQLCADGFMHEACDVWEDILLEYPQDMLALKFAHDSYFYLGYQPQMRDSIGRVLPHWKQSMPLYPYLMGMHSFGLCETNMYEQAEKVARKGLELNSRDAWFTHSLAHVLEMGGRQDEGIAFMSSTVKDWSYCGMLACHNFWHWAVYHIEKGDHQGALDIFDSEIFKRATSSGAMLDIVDACSMLFRLQMEGIDVADRWNDIYETCRPHVDDHLLAFNDAHILMSCLAVKQRDTVDKMMASLRTFIDEGQGTNHTITRRVGVTLCEALVAYSEGEYARAVDMLLPIRYSIVTVGGSNAQRDVFNQFLIHAAMKSQNCKHNKLARSLLVERKQLKENAPLTDRLIARAMIKHE